MANRYSAGCQCCQEAGCSGCVDRYLTSVTVEVGSEVLSIPVNKKIAELVNCEINYTICGDETEVTVLDYSIDHAWDARAWAGVAVQVARVEGVGALGLVVVVHSHRCRIAFRVLIGHAIQMRPITC